MFQCVNQILLALIYISFLFFKFQESIKLFFSGLLSCQSLTIFDSVLSSFTALVDSLLFLQGKNTSLLFFHLFNAFISVNRKLE